MPWVPKAGYRGGEGVTQGKVGETEVKYSAHFIYPSKSLSRPFVFDADSWYACHWFFCKSIPRQGRVERQVGLPGTLGLFWRER